MHEAPLDRFSGEVPPLGRTRGAAPPSHFQKSGFVIHYTGIQKWKVKFHYHS